MPKKETKVYALITLHLGTKEERLTLVAAKTYEEAEFLLTNMFKTDPSAQQYKPGEWYIRSYNSLVIPGQIEIKHTPPDDIAIKQKGIADYISYLSYARDQLCETPEERDSVSKIIAKLITKQYGQTAT